jgi:hypothetical protein
MIARRRWFSCRALKIPRRTKGNSTTKGARQHEAALLAWTFFFFRQFDQKFRQRLLTRKLRGRVGLKSVSGHLDAQRFALAAYLPSPALRVLTASRTNDAIIIDWVIGHRAH